MKSYISVATLLAALFIIGASLPSTLARNGSPCLTDAAKCGVQESCIAKCDTQCSYNAEAVCRECLMSCGAPSFEANCFIVLRYQPERYACNIILTQCKADTPTQIARGGACEVSTLGIVVICLSCAAVASLALFLVLCYPVFLSCCVSSDDPETRRICQEDGPAEYQSIHLIQSEGEESDHLIYPNGSMDSIEPR